MQQQDLDKEAGASTRQALSAKNRTRLRARQAAPHRLYCLGKLGKLSRMTRAQKLHNSKTIVLLVIVIVVIVVVVIISATTGSRQGGWCLDSASPLG